MLNDSQNVITLARQMADAFTGGTREDGSHYRKLSDDAPEWMTDVALAAHMGGEILPCDWIYDKLENAVNYIAETDPIPACFEDSAFEFADSDCDLYNGALAAWLALSCHFAECVDDAAREYGTPVGEGIYRRIQTGQYRFLRDMFDSVVCALEKESE